MLIARSEKANRRNLGEFKGLMIKLTQEQKDKLKQVFIEKALPLIIKAVEDYSKKKKK